MTRTLFKRILLVSIVATGLGALGWVLWPRPVPVDVAAIGRGALEVTVEDEGVTRIRDVYTISAPTSGKMLRAPHKVGDAVIEGKTLVAVFEPSDPAFLDIRTRRVNEAAVEAANAAVRLAEAQVKQAQSQLDFAQAELRRASELAARQAVPERTLERARLDVATGEASVATSVATLEMRRRELESAQARLIQPGDRVIEAEGCCIQVRAPISGRVLKIVAESEQVVQAGAPLLELGDSGDLEIAIDLLSRDAVKVAPGAHARIESWGGQTMLNARVRHVEPTGFTKVSALGIEEQRVKAVLDFTDPPDTWRRLGHGYRVVGRITVWRGEELTLVPLGALFRRGDSWAVFVLEDGRARLRLVEIGERNLHAARVLKGLREDEQVVLHPSDRVQEGTRIAPR